MQTWTALISHLRQPTWRRDVLVFWALMLLPVAGQVALAGWLGRVSEALARQAPTPALRFSELGVNLRRGVAPVVAALTALVAGAAPIAALAAGAAWALGLLEPPPPPEALGVLPEELATWRQVMGGVCGLGAFGLTLFLPGLVTAAWTLGALTGRLGAALRPAAWLGLTARIWGWALVWPLGYAALAALAIALGAAFIGVGALVMTLAAAVGGASLCVQLYALGLGEGAEAARAPDGTALRPRAPDEAYALHGRLRALARSPLASLGAVILVVAHLTLWVLLLDLVLHAHVIVDRPPLVAKDWTVNEVLVALVVVELALSLYELFVRARSARRGSTLPLALLPLGRSVRVVLVLSAALLMLLPRLLLYFLFSTLGLPLFIGLGWMAGAALGEPLLGLLVVPALLGAVWVARGPLSRWIDGFDHRWEAVEQGVNWLYNSLYYNKIEPRGNAFAMVFNASLALWCLNH